MPSRLAVVVIWVANADSLPAMCSASATAMSFALLVAMTSIAVLSEIVAPTRRPSFDGAWVAAWREIVTRSSLRMLPLASCSKARYSVNTLVIDAGKRGASAWRA